MQSMKARVAFNAVLFLTLTSGITAQTSMTKEEKRNETVIRRHHAAINAGDITGAAAFYADTVLNNGNQIDRARILSIMQDNSRTFPDWKMTIDRLIARGDQVVVLS